MVGDVMRPVIAVAACLAALLASATARASLTDSEKGQVRSIVQQARPDSATRLRSLIARPDLSADEASEALAAALHDQPLTTSRQALLQELLFGPASQPSRAALVAPVSRALLGRANALLSSGSQPAGKLLEDREVFDEQMRIHRFLARVVGPESGVGGTLRNDSLRAVAAAYREHFQKHSDLFGRRGETQGHPLLLRAQAAANLAELAAVLMNGEEAATWMDLSGPARGFFIRTGAVIETASQAQPSRIAEIARVLESVPSGLQGVRVVLVDKVQPSPIGPSSVVLPVRARVGAIAPVRDGLWPAELREELPDQALVEAAWAVSLRAARRVFASDQRIARAGADALAHASGKGEATFIAPWLLQACLDRDASTSARPFPPESLAAATATMLLVDARRVVDLAMSKWLAGRPEPLEQVVLGLSLLAASDGSSNERSIELGQQGGRGALRAAVTVRDGLVVRFVIDGHRYEVGGDKGGLGDVKYNGEAASSVAISAASVPVTAGDRWGAKDRELVRLSGAPRAALLDDGRLILASSASSSGPAGDAVLSRAPAVDHEIQAHVRVLGTGGGLLVRASPRDRGFEGAGLLLECATECTGRMVQFSADGTQTPIGEAIGVGAQPDAGFGLRLSVQGDRLRAWVGSTELTGTLARPLQPGHAGFTVRPDSRLEVRAWRIERPGRAAPAATPKR